MSVMSALDTPSLFERIGGSAVVDELIEAFYVRVLADPLLAPFFHDTPLDRLRRMQKEFFAMALGGPIAYSGKSLAHAHHGRGVKREHFAHFVQHLVETLKDIGISQEDADHVIEHINTFSNEITGTSY